MRFEIGDRVVVNNNRPAWRETEAVIEGVFMGQKEGPMYQVTTVDGVSILFNGDELNERVNTI